MFTVVLVAGEGGAGGARGGITTGISINILLCSGDALLIVWSVFKCASGGMKGRHVHVTCTPSRICQFVWDGWCVCSAASGDV